MLDFTFLFLNVHLEFGLEIFRSYSHIPCNHAYFFHKFLKHLKLIYLKLEHGEHLLGVLDISPLLPNVRSFSRSKGQRKYSSILCVFFLFFLSFFAAQKI